MGIGNRLIKCVVCGMKIISGEVMTITKKVIGTIFSLLAELERDLISERTKKES